MKKILLILLNFLFFQTIYCQVHRHDDILTAYPICSSNDLSVKEVQGFGRPEVQKSDCHIADNLEVNSFWIKFRTISNGKLSFRIVPNHPTADVDFVLYKSINNLNNVSSMDNLEEIVCNFSGQNLGEEDEAQTDCLGAVGLLPEANDFPNGLKPGCNQKTTFQKSQQVEAGQTYYLWINNINSKDGFLFEPLSSNLFDFKYFNCEDSTKSPKSIQVNPTLCTTDISINVSVENSQELNYTIYGFDGTPIRTATFFANQGENKINVDVSTFSPGTYFVRIQEKENNYFVAKFIKN
jgi:hypothetical protein